ncbi:hypothetical protein ACSBR2_015878 [Camellia fascicularis]
MASHDVEWSPRARHMENILSNHFVRESDLSKDEKNFEEEINLSENTLPLSHTSSMIPNHPKGSRVVLEDALPQKDATERVQLDWAKCFHIIQEIVCELRNSCFQYHEKYLNLLGYAWQLCNENRASDMMDEVLANSYSESEVRDAYPLAFFVFKTTLKID